MSQFDSVEFFAPKCALYFTTRTLTSFDVAAFKIFLVQIGRETNHTLQYDGKPQNDDSFIEKNLVDAETHPRKLMLGVVDGDRLVALVSIRPAKEDHVWTNHIARFGLAVLKEFWGHGLATHIIQKAEEFAISAGFKRIEAEVRCQNVRGVAFYKRHGYEFEGTRRAAAWIDGVMQDEFYIAKLLSYTTI